VDAAGFHPFSAGLIGSVLDCLRQQIKFFRGRYFLKIACDFQKIPASKEQYSAALAAATLLKNENQLTLPFPFCRALDV
jgi:hypothetical protein